MMDFGVPQRPNVTPRDWFSQPMRWGTLTMTHDDPGSFDPQFWIDYVKASHCDAAAWNSGGIVAFYPTKIPYHKRTEKLGDSDPFGALVDGCRDLGIIVTARVDHHATYDEAARAHPEWLSIDENGQPRRHWAKPDLWLTCGLGTYNANFMTDVMREVMTMYMVDGFNHNRWGAPRVCYCEWCRAHFQEASGADVPTNQDAQDATWQKYQIWREDRMFELWDLWDASVRAINPNAGILPGIGSERERLNMAKVRQRAHTLYLDYQGRSGLVPPWMAGKRGKELRAVLGEKPVGITFSIGHETGKYRWKDSVQSEAEIRIWVAEGVAHGLRPKWCKFDGHVFDARWMPVVEKLYAWQARHEKYLRNTQSLARVAIVHSQQTPRFYQGKSERGNEDASKGLYHALVEARIVCDAVHESLMDDQELDRYKLLMLPNVACLSDAQCDTLRRYVARGGSLLATHETSLYDEWGTRRANFGLSDVFGVSVAGEVEGPMKNSYLNLERDTHHPLLQGFEPLAKRAINGAFRVPVQATTEFPAPPLTLVPPYPDLPMEEVYPRAAHTDIPEFYGRESGASRIGYFPFDIDRVFWEVMDADHGRLLQNAVLWTMGERQPVEVVGQGVLDVAAWRQDGSLTVHLVNLTNPMMMKGPFRELFPIGEQRVTVQLPQDTKIERVHLLHLDQTPQWDIEGDILRVVVPSILDHEVVAVDLA